MSGYIVLEGGAEFGGRMAQPDRRALELAGGIQAQVRIIPAAAAPDNNHQRAGTNGVRWFRSLGALDVQALPLVDRASADLVEIAAALQSARLIYLLGGFPQHLAESLAGSLAWDAILSAYRHGAVIAGSSAGAMVLCQYYYDPYAGVLLDGLNLLPDACVLPHHNTFGITWAPRLGRLLPGACLIGIDEETGLLNDGPAGEWTVCGQGAVTVYEPHGQRTYHHGQQLELSIEVEDIRPGKSVSKSP